MADGIGPRLVAEHLAQMTAMSRKAWPPIVEIEGIEIIRDIAYQGFDDRPDLGWPAKRFWCRSIAVRRLSDGRTGWGIGPQAVAYANACAMLENDRG